MPDYLLKSKVFSLEESSGILTLYNKYRRYRYCIDNGLSYTPGLNDYDIDTLCDLYAFHFAFNPELESECEKILNANRARSYRLRRKILWMLLYCPSVVFCTLTFTDDFLSSTTSSTRRQAVSRFLSSLNVPYIANIDFGDDNGREHYHAVVGCVVPKSSIFFYNEHYGNLDIKRVRFSKLSCLRLSKYVSKLANHAVKVSACRNALLFSRKFPIPSGSALTTQIEEGTLDLVRVTSRVSTHSSYKVIKSPSSAPKMFIKYCSCCGQIIVDYTTNLPKYILSRLISGKSVIQYFCEDCIDLYKIRL